MQILQAYEALSSYHLKYRTRFSVRRQTGQYLKDLLFVLRKMLDALAPGQNGPHLAPSSGVNGSSARDIVAPAGSAASRAAASDSRTTESQGSEGTRVMTVNDFIFAAEVDNVNLFRLCQFIDGSELVKKLNGFLEKYTPRESNVSTSAASSGAGPMRSPDDNADQVVIHRSMRKQVRIIAN